MIDLNKKASLLFFLVAVMLTACGGGSSSSGGSDTNPTVRSVVAISDSLGTGFGIATPWPNRLATGLGVNVNNNSVSGEQTSYGVGIIGNLIDQHQPTHVVILLGTNDAIRGSVSNAIANLQAMVDAARARNVIPIVGTLPPITRSSTENARAAEISTGIRGLSGAVVAEVRGALGNGSLYIVDGVHPNAAGQQVIADTFAGVF